MKAACGPRSMTLTPLPPGAVRRSRPATACARMALTRRRKISLRIAIRCIAKNIKVKPNGHHQQRPAHAWIDGRRTSRPKRLMQRVPPVDREFDDRQYGDADQSQHGGGPAAAASSSSEARQRDHAEIEEETGSSTDVSRASHTQYVPHIGLPQSEPVISARNVKAAPIGAAAFAETSARG